MKTSVKPTQSRTHVSPLAIEMLLHFYAVCAPYLPGPIEAWPRSQRKIVAEFLSREIIEPTGWGYRTTTKGEVIARRTRLAFESLMMEHQ